MTPYSFNDKKQCITQRSFDSKKRRMTQHSFIVKTARRRRRPQRRHPAEVKGNPPFRNPRLQFDAVAKAVAEPTGIVRNLSEPTGTFDATQTL